MQVYFVLYGLPASADAPLAHAEVFVHSDPDGGGRRFMLVWEKRSDAEAFLATVYSGSDDVFIRPVNSNILTSYGVQSHLSWAMNPNRFGATKTIRTPFEFDVVIDSTKK